MKASFRIGRVAGFDVGVHWSVLIIFGLIAWALAGVRFPQAYPGHTPWAYLVAGLATAVIFFAGLLAHEVSHAVLARRNGLTVDSITLWLFGGVARLSGQAPTPGAELRIAGVGPLVSLVIGVGFGAIATGLAAAGNTGLLFGTVAWLGGINIMLAVFNIIPAAPLDGGRLLRAALWQLRGDRTWATVAAATAGRLFGVLLIGLGLAQFLIGAGVGGLWLTLIGWFIFGAAGAEAQQARLGAALGGMRVRDIMTAEPATAPPDVTVAEFIEQYLWTARHSAFPLAEEGRPVGLVTVHQVRGVPADDRARTRLRDIACAGDELTLAGPDELVTELLPRLRGCAQGRALVVLDGRLVGIVSPSDLSRAVQRAALQPPGHP